MTTTPYKRITLNTPWFEYVRDGLKIYEGRGYSGGRFYKGQVLEIIHAVRTSEIPYSIEIIDIFHFKNFKEALEVLPIEEVLPGVESISEGIFIYQKYVSLATQEKDGVIMLRICRK